jgi:flavin reductase (DIM6/NTAB) family NADH-FMN oxidoreductase RutF
MHSACVCIDQNPSTVGCVLGGLVPHHRSRGTQAGEDLVREAVGEEVQIGEVDAARTEHAPDSTAAPSTTYLPPVRIRLRAGSVVPPTCRVHSHNHVRAFAVTEAIARSVSHEVECEPPAAGSGRPPRRVRRAYAAPMPVKQGPVPPFPSGADPDEYDRLRRRVLWKMPSGLYVVGSTDRAQRRNGMTLNWAMQVSFDPKWLGVAIEREAFTHELVEAGGVFSLCLIDRDDRAIVRKFTKPVDVDLEARTLNGVEYFDGPATTAPVLAQSVAYLECEVRERVVAGNHTLFLGEAVNAAFLKPEDTPVLRMEDTRMNYGG